MYGVDAPFPCPRCARATSFFSGLGHVGLYVGHGRMIHAPQSGRNVEIEALGARSYPPVGARRITAF
jgi:cell wall-associated NlpC family hydrolase